MRVVTQPSISGSPLPLLEEIARRRHGHFTRVLCIGSRPALLDSLLPSTEVQVVTSALHLPTGESFDLVVYSDRWWRPALAPGTTNEATVLVYYGATPPPTPHGDIYGKISRQRFRALVPHPVGLAIEQAARAIGAGQAPPTELCHIMSRNRSDKGMGWHNYTLLYDRLFSGMRGTGPRVFELGIGTNDTAIPSHMGAEGRPGASLYGWCEYFGAGSRVMGGDIDPKIQINHPQIRTVVVDQRSPESIRAAFASAADMVPFDLIVEDGLHEYAANEAFLRHSWSNLSQTGGIYVVEDIRSEDLEQMTALVARLREHVAYARLARLPHEGNTVDNNVVVLVKERHSVAELSAV